MKNKTPILVIVAPTASGKSDVAVDIALKYNGEIVSADSRQVYKSLNHTTGKITKEEMKGVPHYMLDVVDVEGEYSAYNFATEAVAHIDDIISRKKLPIIVGGTGFYIDAVLFDGIISNAPNDYEYRKKLENVCIEDLQNELKEKDVNFYDKVDQKNSRRLIRALEIIKCVGKVPTLKKEQRYDFCMIGIKHGDKDLYNRIEKRLDLRFENMVEEIEKLIKKGVSTDWLERLGLQCKHVSRIFSQGISKEEARDNLFTAIKKYAKRQKTWLKRYKDVEWFYLDEYKKMYKYLDKIYKK